MENQVSSPNNEIGDDSIISTEIFPGAISDLEAQEIFKRLVHYRSSPKAQFVVNNLTLGHTDLMCLVMEEFR
jgi:hypothetical protein